MICRIAQYLLRDVILGKLESISRAGFLIGVILHGAMGSRRFAVLQAPCRKLPCIREYCACRWKQKTKEPEQMDLMPHQLVTTAPEGRTSGRACN